MKKLLINAAAKGAKKLAGKIAGKSKKSLGTLKAKPNAFKGVQRPSGKGGTLKPKPNAFKGVASAGATKAAKAAKTTAKRMPKVNPYGAAAAVGAAGGIALQSKIQKAKKSPAAPKMSAPKKAAPKKAAPKKTATVKIAPYKAKSVVAKAKPRAASSTPTAKKTPLSVSAGKKKVGYVKSKRSLRRR